MAGDDEGVFVVDEGDDALVFVGAADAEVAEFAGVAHGDDAGGVDFVVAYAPVVFEVGDGGVGLGAGVVDGVWGVAVEGAVGAFGVVDGLEFIELGLEFS